jgi:ATP-binding cassette subfamily F protein 3
MIHLNNVTLQFGGEPIFEDLSWTITAEPHRIGLIGPNGAGKTTLLKVIAGRLTPDSGTVDRGGGTEVGYLEQDVQEMPPDRSIREEALTAFSSVVDLEEEEAEITRRLNEIDDYESDEYEKLLDRLQTVQEKLNAAESHRMRPRVEATLTGLGFDPDELDRPLRTFSGGWRMRVALAKLLLRRPDVLLLDEPTNHLDIDSIDWLEEYLKNYPGTVIIVSHDRYFLDRMVTEIAELTRGRLWHFDGNYSYYEEAKEERYEQWRKEYENQQKRIKEIEAFISKFRYNASKASQVQSRIKKLEKMDKIPEPPSEEDTISFRFPEPERSGAVVMELSEFSKTYESDEGPVEVFDDAQSLMVERGDKIAIVGPNGAGKSTLARILTGKEPFEGERSLGHNVNVALYAQHQADTLDPDATVLQAVREVAPRRDDTELRNLLGTFLFTGDDVFKKTRVLSGGEKSRVALARTLLSPANCLILDEPTNHLDIQSKNVLIEALQQYEGTFIIVSHDRHFLDEVVEKVWRVGGRRVRTFIGNYSEYRWQVEEGSAADLDDTLPDAEQLPGRGTSTSQGSSSNGRSRRSGSKSRQASGQKTSGKKTSGQKASAQRGAGESGDRFAHLNSYQLKHKLEEVEAEIMEKEEKQEELEAAMADPDAYEHTGRAAELTKQYNALKRELADLYDAWETLTDRVMALD